MCLLGSPSCKSIVYVYVSKVEGQGENKHSRFFANKSVERAEIHEYK